MEVWLDLAKQDGAALAPFLALMLYLERGDRIKAQDDNKALATELRGMAVEFTRTVNALTDIVKPRGGP